MDLCIANLPIANVKLKRSKDRQFKNSQCNINRSKHSQFNNS